MTIETQCPECDAEFEVEVTFGESARTYGPPEQCHDGSSDQVSDDKCPQCGAKLDEDKLIEKAADRAMEAALSREEAREEARRSLYD